MEVLVPINKFFRKDVFTISNTVFRLHYRVTVLTLVMFVGVVAATQYAGSPIECVVYDSIMKRETMNNYCWIHSTYTSVYRPNKKLEAHPGVRQIIRKEEEIHHKYYQWVPFVLLIQAMIFYFPHHLWKNVCEGERMKDLVANLIDPIGDAEEKTKRKKLLLDYIVSGFGLEKHLSYACKLFFCELLNLVNVVAQILITNRFLNFEFTNYGLEVLNLLMEDPENRVDPMDRLFPKVGKCTFKVYGPSGNVVPYDALCVLPINNTNEKIFVFLWGWFILLAVISTFAAIFRIATMCCRPMRSYLLFRKSKACNFKECDLITNRISFSDWFLLSQIGQNVEPSVFADLVSDIHKKLTSDNEEPEANEKDIDEQN